MTARTCFVAAEMKARGLAVQVLDYRWNQGESITHNEPDFILRYRPYPNEVNIAARLATSRLTHFGQLMFHPAEIAVETNPAEAEQRTRNIMCRFDPVWFRNVWAGANDWSADDLAKCYDMRNPRIVQAVQRLGQEASDPGFASELLAESFASVIAVEIARHFGDSLDSLRVRTRHGKLSQADLGRIEDYIRSVVNRCPSIEDISQQCDISPAHLRRSFKNTVGKTVHQYVEEVRLEKAKALLAETDLPLKEISYRLGFADSSTFSSTFRKSAGETPSGYRYRTRQ